MSRYAVPLGIIAFCLGAFWLTTQFDRVPPILLRGMQPSDFPQLVLILIMLMAGLVMLRPGPAQDGVDDVGTGGDDDAEGTKPDATSGNAPVSRHVWASMGLLLVFVAVAQIDLFLGLGVFAGCLSLVWGERRWWALGIVMLLAPLCVFFLFDQVFEVRFPRGLLTELWYG